MTNTLLVPGAAGLMGGHGCRALLDAEPGFDCCHLGESTTVRRDELISLIAGAVGTEPEIEHLLPKPGDVTRAFADIFVARRVLGYEPQVTIEGPALVTWCEETYGH